MSSRYKLFNKTSDLIVLQSNNKKSITLVPQIWTEITEEFLASSHYLKLKDKNKVQLFMEEIVNPSVLTEVVVHEVLENASILADDSKEVIIEEKRSKKKV